MREYDGFLYVKERVGERSNRGWCGVCVWSLDNELSSTFQFPPLPLSQLHFSSFSWSQDVWIENEIFFRKI